MLKGAKAHVEKMAPPYVLNKHSMFLNTTSVKKRIKSGAYDLLIQMGRRWEKYKMHVHTKY